MEKHTLAPRDVEHTAPSHSPIATPTRPSRATARRFAIAVLVAVFLPLGYFLRHPLSHLIPSSSCHRLLAQLTVEQRAQKILRENPLIDGHNDLLISLRMRYKNLIYGHDFKEKFEHGGFAQHVDLPRLDQGMQGGAF
ncbi:hypothetical protein PMIN04_006953 [Paraphaeosphaeria minitans]